MRQLLLLRHAKSSWASPEVDDFDRPLNKRGKRSAKAVGAWISAQGLVPEAVWCSAARRTRETWEGLGLPGEAVLREDLYHAEAGAILEILRTCAARSLMVIGHNPGLAELAHGLVAEAPAHPRFDDYPTAALLVARFEIDDFAALAPGTGSVAHFLTPHDLLKPRGAPEVSDPGSD